MHVQQFVSSLLNLFGDLKSNAIVDIGKTQSALFVVIYEIGEVFFGEIG